MTSDYLIVFDCDGVLVDSERLMQDIDLEMIANLGWPITREEIMEQHLGRSEATVTANIERHLGKPVPDTFVEDRRAAHAAAFRTDLTEVAGITTTLSELQQAGYATCVASSGTHTRIRLMLATANLRGFFADRIFSSEDVERGKPAPDLFLHAAQAMGFEPGRCVVVEDSPSGVAAATAAGMDVIGFCETTPAKALGDATVLISEMAKLSDAIHQLTERTE
ncbi:HAD family phosphatase [Microlunatus elymi]|uniref:HAD family phosphatase n=1 Tax=Microlunatus elymi TaxID=2596828 RepID=A0A516PW09_9ACTN|nr:HAD family phosphatase [Microlunatus elymi]QDP95322.1 HAD family phosphatase [Microlunatus elymi]